MIFRRRRAAEAGERPAEGAEGRVPAEAAPAEARPVERAPAERSPGGVAAADAAPARTTRPARRGVRWKARDAGAATVGAAGAGFVMLARLVMAVAALIALLIVLAIVLRDVDASATNSVVKGIHEGANFFAGAFTGLITWSGNHPKREITVNWGIAALAYLIVGAIVASLIARVGRGGLRYERARRTAATQY